MTLVFFLYDNCMIIFLFAFNIIKSTRFFQKMMATPLCPYFGKCGGCSSQHIDYSLQLENKKNVVSHNTGFKDVKIVSDNEYYYRNRMDFIFHKNGLGFREKGKWHSIINIDQCAIADNRINKLMGEIKDYFRNFDAIDLVKQTGTFKQVVIRSPKNTDSISFILNENSTRLNEAVDKIKEYSKASTAENIAVSYVDKGSEVSTSANYFMVKGSDTISEEFLGKKFTYNIQGFFQNNSKMAEKMLEYTNGLLKQYDTKNASLLDLYGGVGTFGIINSELFREVTVIESFKASIDSANINIKENNIKNIKAMVLDAKNLRRVKFSEPLFVITDPPRSGMDIKTILALRELEPEVIIYISCNPQQLGKELPKLKNYKVKSAAMFDLFPQTPHMEAVVELVRT